MSGWRLNSEQKFKGVWVASAQWNRTVNRIDLTLFWSFWSRRTLGHMMTKSLISAVQQQHMLEMWPCEKNTPTHPHTHPETSVYAAAAVCVFRFSSGRCDWTGPVWTGKGWTWGGRPLHLIQTRTVERVSFSFLSWEWTHLNSFISFICCQRTDCTTFCLLRLFVLGCLLTFKTTYTLFMLKNTTDVTRKLKVLPMALGIF